MIRAPVYQKGAALDPDSKLDQKPREKVLKYKKALEELPEKYTARYFKVLEDPVGLITTLISELVEDCCFVLEISKLPATDEIRENQNFGAGEPGSRAVSQIEDDHFQNGQI